LEELAIERESRVEANKKARNSEIERKAAVEERDEVLRQMENLGFNKQRGGVLSPPRERNGMRSPPRLNSPPRGGVLKDLGGSQNVGDLSGGGEKNLNLQNPKGGAHPQVPGLRLASAGAGSKPGAFT